MGERTPYDAGRDIYEYVKRNKKNLPDYWQDKGTNVCILGVCAMVARCKFTNAEIAEFYECSEMLIEEIRFAYKKTIRKLLNERREVKEIEERLNIENDVMKNANDNIGYVELLRRVFER